MSHFPVYKLMPWRKALSPKVTNKMSDSFHHFMSAVIEPYEPAAPLKVTTFPGPNLLSANDKLSHTIANSDNLREVVNLERSMGNYFTDVDGNVVLDMFQDNGRNTFGYNSRRWIRDTKFQKYQRF